MKSSSALFRFLLSILVWILVSTNSSAVDSFGVSSELNKVNLATYLYYISDKNDFAIEQIIEAPQEDLKWQRNPKDEALNLGFQSDFFWFRVDFNNTSTKPLKKLLEIAYPLLDVVDYYEVKHNAVINRSLQGNAVKFSNRIYDHRNFLYPIKLEPGESVSIYVHIKGLAALQVPIYLWDIEYFWQKDQLLLGIQAVYVGLMLIMMLYHLFLAWGTRDKMYLIYVGILASIFVFLTCYYGVAHQFFWSGLTGWNARAVAISVPLNNLLVLLFAMEVLSTRTLAPRSHKFLKTLVVLLGFVAIGGATLPSNIMAPIYTAMVFIAFTALLSICYRLWSRCQTEGRIFTAAYSVYLVGCLSMALNKFGIIPASTLTESFVQIGSAIETVLLSLALATRINRLRVDSVKLIKTEMKAKQAELIAQHEINESKAKTQFLAMMSHEIRTPMNGVLGLLDILKNTSLDGKQRYLVENIQGSGEVLLTIINDVLDYSKAYADKLELENIPLDPCQLVEECALLFSTKTKQASVPLFAYISPNVPKLIDSDPTRLKQVIYNLLSNAFKFTEKGHIFLKGDLVQAQDGNRFRLEIHDTGIGITPSQIDKLFTSFVQADSSTARKYGGTGLGLAISKKIVVAMGGEIGVTSEPGKGSTFWLEFPIHTPPTPLETPASKILVCTNYPPLGELISDLSETLPLSVTSDSFESLDEMLVKSTRIEFDRCIIYNSDINLDVQKIATRLKETTKQEIPIYVIEMDTDKALDDQSTNPQVVASPIFLNSLLGIGTNKPASPEQASMVAELPSKVAQMNILIAEDNPVNQMVIKGILTPMVNSIKIVDNGQEVVSEFTQNRNVYDLIFMDCEMPVMDGYEASRQIREFEENSGVQQPIPIVALTAHALDRFKKKAMDSGMNDHLAKPIKGKLMIQFFNRFLQENPLKDNNEMTDGSLLQGSE